jgi:hypothetical protein
MTPHVQQIQVPFDDELYQVEVFQRVSQPPASPRLVIVAYQPNELASQILKVCIQAVQRYTPEPHELWVIDNCSPKSNKDWLVNLPDINLAFNNTFPLPPGKRRFWHHWRLFQHQQKWGSYANAVGLELAVRLIDPESQYLLTLHMDTAPCRSGWLSYLQSKLDDRVRAAGVHLQRNRVPEGVLHVVGCLIDFQLFQRLNLDFFPDLPHLDVGDRVTVALRQAGYDVAACRDTLNQPEIVDSIPDSSPFKHLNVFRALDDQNNVIFLHLGRGVRKTTGEHRRGVTPQEWVTYIQNHILT